MLQVKAPRRRDATAFTLIEALVVISVITLLLSISMPSLRTAKESGRAAVCLAQLRDMGNAITAYCDDFRNELPYGVPLPVSVIDHPQNAAWPAGARPPQQQFYTMGYIRDTRAYICPTDPHPENYVWWEYKHHPDITGGSSYMFSEFALFGVAWLERRILKQTNIWQPSTFGYATDGWECPNGWTWGVLDREDPLNDPSVWWSVRIDWDHLKGVNVLYGDNHAARMPQKDARWKIRTHPLKNQ